MQRMNGDVSSRTTILIDGSKGETAGIQNGLRSMHRKLKNQWRVET